MAWLPPGVTPCDNGRVTPTTDEPAPCPTPDKKVRATTEAEAYIAAFRANFTARTPLPHGGHVEAYRCPCGLWHVRDAEKHRRKHGARYGGPL